MRLVCCGSLESLKGGAKCVTSRCLLWLNADDYATLQRVITAAHDHFCIVVLAAYVRYRGPSIGPLITLKHLELVLDHQLLLLVRGTGASCFFHLIEDA